MSPTRVSTQEPSESGCTKTKQPDDPLSTQSLSHSHIALSENSPLLLLQSPLPHHCKVFHLLPELMPVILQRRKSTGPFKNLIWAPSPLPLNLYPTDGGLAPAGNTSTLWICCKSLGSFLGFFLLTRWFRMTRDAFLFL